jgi:hypothetical protein
MPPPLLRASHSILEKLRDATARSIVTWKRAEDSDEFVGECGKHSFLIKFKYPAYGGDEGSDRDYVEVHTFDHVRRFMVGTEGWHLALEVLAAGVPEYAEHVAALMGTAKSDLRAMNGLLRGGRARRRRAPRRVNDA